MAVTDFKAMKGSCKMTVECCHALLLMLYCTLYLN